jgi:predicted transcriptional regulator
MVSKSSKLIKVIHAATAGTASVTLRVRRDHLAQLDRIAAEKGTVRAAQIQTAISEFIQRNAK